MLSFRPENLAANFITKKFCYQPKTPHLDISSQMKQVIGKLTKNHVILFKTSELSDAKSEDQNKNRSMEFSK